MTETLSPPQPRKKIKWLLAVACLLLLAGSGWLYFLLMRATSGDKSYRLVIPGRAVSVGSFSFIAVEVAPESAQDGMAGEFLGTSHTVKPIAFICEERHGVKIRVTAGKDGVEKDGLSYAIFGENDEKLSQGKVNLPSSLKAGESGKAEISDRNFPYARRIEIYK